MNLGSGNSRQASRATLHWQILERPGLSRKAAVAVGKVNKLSNIQPVTEETIPYWIAS